MSFTLRNPDETSGLWVPYEGDPTGYERYKIRPLYTKKRQALLQASEIRTPVNGRRAQVQDVRYDHAKFMIEAFVFCVEDWEGVYQEMVPLSPEEVATLNPEALPPDVVQEGETYLRGIPLPCTDEYKRLLAEQSSDRLVWAVEMAGLLANSDEERRKAEEATFRPVLGLPTGSSETEL